MLLLLLFLVSKSVCLPATAQEDMDCRSTLPFKRLSQHPVLLEQNFRPRSQMKLFNVPYAYT